MVTTIPPISDAAPAEKLKRWHVFTSAGVYLELQRQAVARGTDIWTLAGAVLGQWLQAGAPDVIRPTTDSLFPCPSPSFVAGPVHDTGSGGQGPKGEADPCAPDPVS